MKKTLIATALALLLPTLAFAAYNDVSLDTTVVLSVNGASLTIFGTSAALQSIVVDSTSFTLTMPTNSHIKINSSTRKIMTHTANASYVTSNSCTSDGSLLGFATPSGDAASIVVTVSTSACTIGGTATGNAPSSIGGGGSGGGGGSTSYVPLTPTPTTTHTPAVTTPAPSAPASGGIMVAISKNLAPGSSNLEVKLLQAFLATDPSVYPEAKLTGFYGALTRLAVQRFQEKYGLAKASDAGYGNVGPKTRAKILEVSGGTAAPAAPTAPVAPATTGTTGGTFSVALYKGVKNAEVTLLQKVLNANADTQVSTSGAGSPGSESSLFGSLTEKAVQKFQEKYGLATAGDSGYGRVGPKTRAKLNELAASLGL